MSRLRVSAIERDFAERLRRNRALVRDANKSGARPAYSEALVGLAFLKSFIALEIFLEESFLYYLAGKKSKSGKTFGSYLNAVSDDHARDILKGSRDKIDWSGASEVIKRAQLYFPGGLPFEAAMSPRVHIFNNAKTIRNAVAHESAESIGKLESLIRAELGFVKTGSTAGKFLNTVVLGSNPPQTYFEKYVSEIELCTIEIAK